MESDDHEQSPNGNGTGGDDRELAADLDDWAFAGRGLFRVLEAVGRGIPPFGPDRAAELAHLIAATDAELERLVAAWQTEIRPALTRHENHPPEPAWLVDAHGNGRYVPGSLPPKDAGEYVDGAYVVRLAADGAFLVERVEALRACVPPADEGVAWSITAYHLPRVDEQFGRVLSVWRTAVKPRLRKYARRITRW